VDDRCPAALPGIVGGARRVGDPVGDGEADPEQARQLVGIAAEQLVGIGAVVLMDPGGEIGEAVGREQEMQAPGDAQPLPGLGGLLGLACRSPTAANAAAGSRR